MCAHKCVLHSHVCSSTWRPKGTIRCLLQSPSALLTETFSHWAYSCLVSLDQLASKLQGSPVSTSSLLGFWALSYHTWLLHGCWGSERRSHIHTVSSLPEELLPQPLAAHYSSQQSWFTWFSLSRLLYQITPQTRCFKQFISNTGRWESWFDVWWQLLDRRLVFPCLTQNLWVSVLGY